MTKMSLIPIAVKIVSGALGTFMTGFTILNLCSDIGNPFGSFGIKFIYEMDQIMGGLLGIPHYSKVEVLFLSLAATGAFSSIINPDNQLLPILGFTSLTSYMTICGFYGWFSGTPIAPFLSIATVGGLLLKYHWDNHLDNADDINTATNFAFILTGLTLLAGLIMKLREPSQREINKRFGKINKFCEDNPKFEWKKGKDAPEGFGK